MNQISIVSASVYTARKATLGRRLLVVGGICKEEARLMIARALKCEVVWLDATKGENMAHMTIAAHKCDILIALIRITSHNHTKELTRLSREIGIPLVRVTGGYNPVSIAKDINEQLLRVLEN
jgi:hypothetical protein